MPIKLSKDSVDLGIVCKDADAMVAFYRDVIGLEIQPKPAPTWDSTPWLRAMHGTGDAALRYAIAKVPGTNWGIEFVEFRTSDRRPVVPKVQDPGAATVAFGVRDMAAAVAFGDPRLRESTGVATRGEGKGVPRCSPAWRCNRWHRLPGISHGPLSWPWP